MRLLEEEAAATKSSSIMMAINKGRFFYYWLALAHCFLVLCLGDDAVLKAIDICREKLADDPHFP